MRQIGKAERYTVYAKSTQIISRQEKAKEFIVDFIKATHRIISTYRKEQAVAIIFLQADVYVKFSEMIIDQICRVMLTPPIDMKLYAQVTTFFADLITSPHMQLEKLTSSQR